jgi:4-carboxymuconolactone decarboxylase
MAAPETGSISFDIESRQAHVVGSTPRILPLGHDEADDEAKEIVARLRASAGAARADKLPEYMRVVLKHPAIFRCHMEMGTAIFRGQIPPRERELAVLRVGWLCRAPYEWGEHVDIGKRCGLSAEEIERVTRGSSAAGWSKHERAILRGVEELLADHALSDATWETLANTWNEAQLIEYTVMVGQYVATAFVQNSLRICLAPDNPGLTHR